LILISRQEGAFSLFENSMFLLRKMFRMLSYLFSKTHQLFIDNCLRNQLMVLSTANCFSRVS